MGKSQKGRVATLSRTLQRVTTSLNESFALLDSSAPSASETLEWSEVKKAADLVSKHATAIGLLWTQSSLKVDEAEGAMKTLADSLQGLILLCHGYTVGAGPTLEQTIRNAVKGVLGASLSLLTSAVSFSVKGSSKEEREGALPAIVGCVWEACGVMKKTPFTNRAAIGRSLAQVATSVKDVLREIGEMRDGGKEVEDDGCGCGHAHEAPSGSHSHAQGHSHGSHNHGHGGHNHSHSHDSHNHSHNGPCGHDHSHGHGHDHSHSHGHDDGHSHGSEHAHGACGHDHSHEHVHDHSGHEDCGHEHKDGASSSVESLEFNDELSPEEIVVADATKGVVTSVLAFLKELLYVAADPQQGVVSLSDAMEEFPAPVSVASEETTETPRLATVVAKSTRPRLPVIFYRLLPKPRLKAVEQYIASFEYGLHPQTNFNSQKQRPLFLIMETAKTIITAPQSIKCVEAVFVALFLTAGLPDVERYPLSFQTVLDDQVYQHIVLVVQHFGKFGAVGISRWPEFCSKDLKFHRMSSVIENYKTAYEEQHHVVEKIRVGLPVEHNTRSTNFVCWRHLELDLKELPWRDCVEVIDEFAAEGKRLWNSWIRSRRGEDPRHLYIRQTKRMHADRESSPYKAKRPNSTDQTRSAELTFENSESMDSMDTKIVNCRFNIQPPSSRESARIALSLEPGEVSYFWKKAPQSVLPKEFCFDKSSVAVRLPSKHGFTKFRRSKKAFKSGGDAAIQPVKSARGAIRSLPRAAQSPSSEAPLAVSQSIAGNKYLNATPEFDGPKACWECLRTLYRTKNEARLLLLRDKLADLRMQSPSQMEAFRVVQDIFQKLVGIGEAITSRLDGFEGTMNALSANFDVVVESVNSQKELHSLKQLSNQLAEESLTEDQQLMINFQNKEGVNEKCSPSVGKNPNTSPYLKKMGHDAETHVHYRVPPCNWCGLHGHRMRECQDLEIEIARRVREYKLRISLTLPESSHGEPKEQGSTEESTVWSVEDPSGKLVLWHKNQATELVPSEVQKQTGDSNAQPVAGKKLELLPGGENQNTTPKEKRGSKMSRKKRLVQRRLQTKLMYLLGK